jgi:hypothetical protein
LVDIEALTVLRALSVAVEELMRFAWIVLMVPRSVSRLVEDVTKFVEEV